MTDAVRCSSTDLLCIFRNNLDPIQENELFKIHGDQEKCIRDILDLRQSGNKIKLLNIGGKNFYQLFEKNVFRRMWKTRIHNIDSVLAAFYCFYESLTFEMLMFYTGIDKINVCQKVVKTIASNPDKYGYDVDYDANYIHFVINKKVTNGKVKKVTPVVKIERPVEHVEPVKEEAVEKIKPATVTVSESKVNVMKKSKKTNEAAKKILKHLEEYGEPMNVEEISISTGYAEGKVRYVLKGLIEDGVSIDISKQSRKIFYSYSPHKRLAEGVGDDDICESCDPKCQPELPEEIKISESTQDVIQKANQVIEKSKEQRKKIKTRVSQGKMPRRGSKARQVVDLINKQPLSKQDLVDKLGWSYEEVRRQITYLTTQKGYPVQEIAPSDRGRTGGRTTYSYQPVKSINPHTVDKKDESLVVREFVDPKGEKGGIRHDISPIHKPESNTHIPACNRSKESNENIEAAYYLLLGKKGELTHEDVMDEYGVNKDTARVIMNNVLSRHKNVELVEMIIREKK